MGLIMVERGEGRTVAGLLTSLLANWERIPPSVQTAIIRHAAEAGFESAGRFDGDYVVTAFILKHRAAMMREARWTARSLRPAAALAAKARDAVGSFTPFPRSAFEAASRLVRMEAEGGASRRPGAAARLWSAVTRWAA